MAKKKAQPDEDIIDLTELIETGTSGSKNAAAAYARASAPVDDGDSLDFDSLLANAAGGGEKASSSRPVDPNEELDMSDLGEIDNILESLNMPPQPGETTASQPRTAPSPPPEDDLDSVLDDLLGDPPPQKKAPEPAAPAPEAEDPISDLDADLDNILASIDEPAPAPKAAQAPKTPPVQEKTPDLDDLLGDTGNAKQSTPPPAADDFELPPDLDQLLEESPAEPEPRPQKAAPVQEAMDPQTAQSVAPPVTEAAQPMNMAQIVSQDAIAGICHNIISAQLAPIQEAMQNISRQLGEQSAHFDDLTRTVADISKRLFATESKLTAAKNRISSLETGLASQASFEDLFREGTPLNAGFMKFIAASVSNAVKGIVEKNAGESNVPEHFQELLDNAEQNRLNLEKIEARIDSLEPSITARLDQADTALSNLQASLGEAASDNDRLDKLESRIDNVEPSIMARLDQADAVLANLQASMGDAAVDNDRLDRLEARIDSMEPSIMARLDQTDATLSDLQASMGEAASDNTRLDKLEARIDSMEPSIMARLDQLDSALSNLQTSMGDAAAGNDRLDKLEARIDSVEPSMTARLDSFASELEDQLKSVLKNGQESQVDGAEIKTVQEQLEQLEGRFRELETATASGSQELPENLQEPIAKLQALEERLDGIEKSVEGLQGSLDEKLARLLQSGDEKDKKLDKLLKSDRGVQARMDSLETRLDQLEPNFNIQVEKAATSAVVRILHEEIGKLAEGQ